MSDDAAAAVYAAASARVHAADVESVRHADAGIHAARRRRARRPRAMPFPNPAAMFATLDPAEIDKKIAELQRHRELAHA